MGRPGPPRTTDWVEYEMSLNEMLQQHEDVVVCTYDREALEPERVVDALRSHPMLLIGGILLENPFYVPPVELLTRLREKDAEQLRLRELEGGRPDSARPHGHGHLAGSVCSSARDEDRPCLEVGGDFFSVVPVEDGVAAVVADVSGKGVPAAILASLLQGIIYEALLSRVPFAELAQSVNRFLCARDLGSKYATLVIAASESDGALEYLNCAHVSRSS